MAHAEPVAHIPLVGRNIKRQRFAKGRNITESIALSIRYLTVRSIHLKRTIVAVQIKENVANRTAVFQNAVTVFGATRRVQIVPVNLVAHTVKSVGKVGWDSESRRVEHVAVRRNLALAIAGIAVGTSEIRKRHNVAALSDTAIVFNQCVEGAIIVAVEVNITVHPVARELKRGGNRFARGSQELLGGNDVVNLRRGRDVGALNTLGGTVEHDAVKMASCIRVRLVGREVYGIVICQRSCLCEGRERERLGSSCHADAAEQGEESGSHILYVLSC